jgi:hypothetical protein
MLFSICCIREFSPTKLAQPEGNQQRRGEAEKNEGFLLDIRTFGDFSGLYISKGRLFWPIVKITRRQGCEFYQY